MIANIAGIPVFNALVDDEGTGMIRVSLVDDPAVMSNFLAFDKDRVTTMYRVADEDKRLVFGVLMRANFPIYRKSPSFGEFYIIYTPETIRKMAEKYMAEDRQNNVDTMHDREDVDNVHIVQYFLKDTARGIAPEGFDDISDGSLFAEYHVENDEVWAKIKDGTYRGFSIEIVNDLVPETDQAKVSEIVEETDNFNSQDTSDMSKFAKFKAGLARLLAQFGNVATDKGILAWDGEEDLKAGDAVFVEDSDGYRTAAPDGDYITADAKTIRVADGKVSEIVDPEAEVDAAFGRKGTDKGELVWDGEEDLKAGDEVYIEQDGERTAAPDGEYRTEDGKVIVVVEGRVSEIRDAEAEVAPKDDTFSRITAAFSESYDEKRRRIMEAIAELGFDGWLADCGDDFAVLCAWTGAGEAYNRFEISWDADGKAIAKNPVKVVPAFVTVEERKAADAELENLRRQVEELSGKSAAKPAHEEVVTAGKIKKTGIKGLDNLARILNA